MRHGLEMDVRFFLQHHRANSNIVLVHSTATFKTVIFVVGLLGGDRALHAEVGIVSLHAHLARMIFKLVGLILCELLGFHGIAGRA